MAPGSAGPPDNGREGERPMAENGYAGDVSSREAWDMLSRDPNAVLIDVRTDAEWAYVGLPDLRPIEKQPLMLSWQVYPEMAVNSHFADQLRAAGVGQEATLLFICRSGQRSRSAAIQATAAGYGRSYNVSDGFEGPLDEESHRGRKVGWKAAGLPWVQR